MADFIRIEPPQDRQIDTRARPGGGPARDACRRPRLVRWRVPVAAPDRAVHRRYLNAMRRSGQPVELRLRDGSLVVGRLLDCDEAGLIVELDGRAAVVFRHAVDLVKPRP